MFLLLSLYMSTVLGYSPLSVGIAYLPFCAVLVVALAASAPLVTRHGHRPAAGVIACVQQLGAAAGLAVLTLVTLRHQQSSTPDRHRTAETPPHLLAAPPLKPTMSERRRPELDLFHSCPDPAAMEVDMQWDEFARQCPDLAAIAANRSLGTSW